MVELEWEENDGPHVTVPASRGFGTRSVIASIETQLGGRASFDWRPEGLLCRLTVPLAEHAGQHDQPAIGKAGNSNGEAAIFLAERRVQGRAGG